MQRRGTILAAPAIMGLAALLFATGPAGAQSGLGRIEGEAVPGRYQIVRIEGAVARLDTATGSLAPCRVEGDMIVCGDGDPTAADDRAASDARIRALEARIEALETVLAENGPALPGGDETDLAIDRMQKLFRGFADIVKELDQDRASEGPKEPSPNRT